MPFSCKRYGPAQLSLFELKIMLGIHCLSQGARPVTFRGLAGYIGLDFGTVYCGVQGNEGLRGLIPAGMVQETHGKTGALRLTAAGRAAVQDYVLIKENGSVEVGWVDAAWARWWEKERTEECLRIEI